MSFFTKSILLFLYRLSSTYLPKVGGRGDVTHVGHQTRFCNIWMKMWSQLMACSVAVDLWSDVFTPQQCFWTAAKILVIYLMLPTAFLKWSLHHCHAKWELLTFWTFVFFSMQDMSCLPSTASNNSFSKPHFRRNLERKKFLTHSTGVR